jgi:hypothetical protein
MLFFQNHLVKALGNKKWNASILLISFFGAASGLELRAHTC